MIGRDRRGKYTAATGSAGSDTDALQTDVMRFMSILGLCLMAVFALVQSIPRQDTEGIRPEPELEMAVLQGETGIAAVLARKLVTLATALRALKDHDLEEAASTRLLVYAATLIQGGYDPLDACRAALVEPLTDDVETSDALMEVVYASFGT